ncbi:MAG: glycosyltransferase family 2 protein [Chitinophagaceae bacterium]
MPDNFMISIVIPCLNEEHNIFPVYEQLRKALHLFNQYEIIFVDDGSTDGSLTKMEYLSEHDICIRYIKLSKCFGLQNALKAGIDLAHGDCIITMDADMQHPPSLIPAIVQKWMEGYKIVFALRQPNQNTSLFKKATSSLFYKLFNFLSDANLQKGTSDFRLIDRQVADVIISLKEHDPFIRALIPWSGFNQTYIKYAPLKRVNGKTKFTYRKMFSLAAVGLTSSSIKPLRLSLLIGIICSVFSFMYGIFAILINIFTERSVPGWTSIIASLLFLSGIQLIVLGIIGEYIGKIFLTTRCRPAYIIEKTNISTSEIRKDKPQSSFIRTYN